MEDVLEFLAKHGIVIEAYGNHYCIDITDLLLCSQKNQRLITTYPGGPLDAVLATIARRIGGTPCQVIFKWAHAKGFVVVMTISRRTRLDEYLDVVHLRAFPHLSPSVPRS